MVRDGQKVWTDGQNGWTDARTDDAKIIYLRLRRGIISVFRVTGLKILGRVGTHIFY